jgi:hypothetical protein
MEIGPETDDNSSSWRFRSSIMGLIGLGSLIYGVYGLAATYQFLNSATATLATVKYIYTAWVGQLLV